MRRPLLSVLILAGVFALAFATACSSRVRAQTAFDPSTRSELQSWRTYAWVPARAEREGGPDPAEAAQLRGTIDRQLQERGFVKVDRSPDFRVDAHAALEPKVEATDRPGYRGPGWNQWAPAVDSAVADGLPRPSGPVTGSRPQDEVRQSSMGTLLMEVRDGRSDQVVWRGHARQPLPAQVSERKRESNLDRSVARLLEGFPPGEPAQRG